MSRSSSEERNKAPKCPFEVYRSEGDAFLIKKKYLKAVMAYDQALDKKQNDRYCLLRRSSCNLALGNLCKALSDVDIALSEDSNYYKALYLKGQILYSKGEFEHALVYFHRGHQQRPELQIFRLGIQKSEEAIENSLTNHKKIKVRSGGAKGFTKQMDDEERAQKSKLREIAQKSRKVAIDPSARDADQNGQIIPISLIPKHMSKVMFGPLYTDHEYLEELLKQESTQRWKTTYSEDVRNLARSGITYLDERSKFWHQEKPVYARTKAKRLKSMPKSQPTKKQHCAEINKVLNKLHYIDRLQRKQQHELAVKQAENLLHEVEAWNPSQFLNYYEILANINSMLGLSNLELGNYAESLEAHQIAYKLGQENNLPEVISHSMDNMGRVYAKQGDYNSAIKIWEEKLEKCTDELDTIWLCYELGRCYLELQNPVKSYEYGVKALDAASAMNDKFWQLNINVLIGQSHLQLKKRNEAQMAFTKAYELAKELKAHDAEKAILEVIDELQSTDREMDTDAFTDTEDNVQSEDSHVSRNKSQTPDHGNIESNDV
ncbi:Tetratricopeptide repeat protein 25 [Schistosoma japonicum]|nr:Tetratricopeptide repeat protein 25 [Schistosoma japonicum]